MIISHSKKFAFFANPKTGSKAVGLTLRLSGIFDKNDIMSAQPFPATRTARIELPEYNLNGHKTYLVDHMNPQDAIEAGYITLEQLRDYNCYAFLRDPEERFFAAEVCMQVSRHGNIAMPDRKGKAAPAQYTYFFVGDALIINPLNFGNFEQEVRFILAQLGADEQIDAPQVSKIIRPHMIYDVEYDPAQHTKDIALYKNMMQ